MSFTDIFFAESLAKNIILIFLSNFNCNTFKELFSRLALDLSKCYYHAQLIVSSGFSIKHEDQLIQEKGVDSLSEAELCKVCRERGIQVVEELRQHVFRRMLKLRFFFQSANFPDNHKLLNLGHCPSHYIKVTNETFICFLLLF